MLYPVSMLLYSFIYTFPLISNVSLSIYSTVSMTSILPYDSDRPPPGQPGSQSDAVAARRHGSRSREANSFRNAWIPTGPAPSHGRPGADTTIPGTARSTPKAYRYGLETTTLRRLVPVDALGIRPMHGTTTRKGAGSK
jgi:hypothetical protein